MFKVVLRYSYCCYYLLQPPGGTDSNPGRCASLLGDKSDDICGVITNTTKYKTHYQSQQQKSKNIKRVDFTEVTEVQTLGM